MGKKTFGKFQAREKALAAKFKHTPDHLLAIFEAKNILTKPIPAQPKELRASLRKVRACFRRMPKELATPLKKRLTTLQRGVDKLEEKARATEKKTKFDALKEAMHQLDVGISYYPGNKSKLNPLRAAVNRCERNLGLVETKFKPLRRLASQPAVESGFSLFWAPL